MTPEELHELNLRCVRAMGETLCPGAGCGKCTEEDYCGAEFYEELRQVIRASGERFSPATDPAQAHAMVDEWLSTFVGRSMDLRKIAVGDPSTGFMELAWCVVLRDDEEAWRAQHVDLATALSLAFCEAVERMKG